MTTGYIERLEREISASHNALRAKIANRRDHPSFGYTKTQVRSDLAVLEGMIVAWLYVSRTWGHPGAVLFTRETLQQVQDALVVDIASLREAVK